MSDILEVVDSVSDLSVTVAAAYEDPTVLDALEDAWRNEAAITDADLEAMHAAAEADGIDASPFADITPARYAEIMRMAPTDTGWSPEVLYVATADLPFRAQLRRGTPNGPDMIRLAYFSSAENALTSAVLFLINMKLIWLGHGDDATREAVRSQIEYATR